MKTNTKIINFFSNLLRGKPKPQKSETPKPEIRGREYPLYENCSLCNERTYLPFYCEYCRKFFCGTHRLPFNHNCENIKNYGWTPPGDGHILIEKIENKKTRVDETIITTTPLIRDISAIVMKQEGIFERDLAYHISDVGFDGMREKHRAVWNTINVMVANGHLRRHMGGLHPTRKTQLFFEGGIPTETPVIDRAMQYFSGGDNFVGLRRYSEAVDLYDKAIALIPYDADVWNNRGSALENLGRHIEAYASFEKAIAINSDYAMAWYNRGVVLENLGRHEEAVDSFNKAIAVKPDYVLALNRLKVAREKTETKNKRKQAEY